MKTGPKLRTIIQAIELVRKKASRHWSGCLIYDIGYPVGFGYRYIRANDKSWYVHRLVFFFENGFLPAVVMHTCDTPTCIEPTHLIAGTHADNVADKTRKGRVPKGETHYRYNPTMVRKK